MIFELHDRRGEKYACAVLRRIFLLQNGGGVLKMIFAVQDRRGEVLKIMYGLHDRGAIMKMMFLLQDRGGGGPEKDFLLLDRGF